MHEVTMSDIMERLNGGMRYGNAPMYGNQHVKFKLEVVQDEHRTAKEGRPIYKEIEVVEVTSPHGEKTCVEVTDRHRHSYPQQYAAFKARNEKPTVGTPLNEWAMMPRTVVMELAFFNIKTVEDLAKVDEEGQRKMGPLVDWVARADKWLKASGTKQAQVVQLQEENARLFDRIKKMEEQIELLLQRCEANEGTRLRREYT